METVQKQRLFCILFLMASVFLALLFSLKLMAIRAFIFGATSILLLIFVIKINHLIYEINLIKDNPIIKVSSAVILTENGIKKGGMEETIISTFGILIGSETYKWGSDGIGGVKLKTIEIDRMRIYLTFGDKEKTMTVKLLHGIEKIYEIKDIKEKLWEETCVKATVSGWQGEKPTTIN